MKKKSINLPKAFSLVELSLVLLLIGAVMLGMLKGASLVAKSRLAAAQTITKKSSVNDMSGLVAWYETSLDTSFLPSERKEGSLISTWIDNTPDASPRNNATQSDSASQPLYYNDIFNSGIPGIRFDGTNDALFFDGLSLINNSYTIFVVEQRQSAEDSNFFIGGSGANSNTNLYLGYRNSDTLIFSHYINDLTYTVPSFSDPIVRIHTFHFGVTTGKRYWLNGGSAVDSNQSAQTDSITSYANPAIGRSQTFYYNGEIAEIIIFARALQISEKELVENYLSKKYNISLE